ncbi:MAG: anti-sigma factor family protein [Gemmatimonadaceae bacterium]
MTDCPNGALRDLLPDLVNGRLSPEVRYEVERHVAACPECAAELALLRELRASMAGTPFVDAARIATVIPAYRAPVRRSWGGWRAAAAVAAIVAGGASVAVVRQAGTRGPEPVQSMTFTIPDTTVVAKGSPSVPSARPAERGARAVPAVARELAMASGAASDLSDRELQALLKDIESIDAVPSVDVENAALVSPVSPRGRSE